MDAIYKVATGYVLNPVIAKQISDYESAMKQMKQKEDELKKQILSAMEDAGIVKLETDDVTISYIAATDRETFDSKRFKKDNPDIYDDYVKFSHVKPSIRVKVK